MNLLKYCVALIAVVGLPLLARAQQGAPPSGPKPTLADVQKVVALLRADKTKLQLFCDLAKIDEQMAVAEQKKDTKTMEALDKKAEDMAKKIGAEYINLMTGLEQVDPSSPEGQQLTAPFDELGKQCPK